MAEPTELAAKLDAITQYTESVYAGFAAAHIRARLLRAVRKAMEDSQYDEPEYDDDYDELSDLNIVRMTTHLLWHYSQQQPTHAARRYDQFSHDLYAHWKHYETRLGRGRERFERAVRTATDKNPAWKQITKQDASAREDICETALTMTTMIFGQTTNEGIESKALWQRRQYSG